MPSKQSEAVRRHWAQSREAWENPEAEQRDNEAWGDLTAEPRGVDYLEVEAGGRPAMWLVPKGAAEDTAMLCFHGGGFVGGSIYTHRKLFGHLAKAMGVRALLFGYDLAPEHIFPTQLDQATDVYAWLLEQGVKPGKIVFAGDSVGGGLAIVVQLRARERGLPLPAAALVISPWVDTEFTGDSYTANRDRDAFFSLQVVQGLLAIYLGPDGDPRDPLVNPLYGDLSGFGPIYIQAGGDEVLADDARLLEEHARKAGVEVRLEIFPDMQHTFQMAAGRAPEADDAIRRLAEWARPRLGERSAH